MDTQDPRKNNSWHPQVWSTQVKMANLQFGFPALVGCCWPPRSLTHRRFPWANLAAPNCRYPVKIKFTTDEQFLWTTRLLAAAAWDGDLDIRRSIKAGINVAVYIFYISYILKSSSCKTMVRARPQAYVICFSPQKRSKRATS